MSKSIGASVLRSSTLWFTRIADRFFPPIKVLHPLPCHRFDAKVHEELHILFPRFGEAMICAMTGRRVRSMSKKDKDRLYARIRSR